MEITIWWKEVSFKLCNFFCKFNEMTKHFVINYFILLKCDSDYLSHWYNMNYMLQKQNKNKNNLSVDTTLNHMHLEAKKK